MLSFDVHRIVGVLDTHREGHAGLRDWNIHGDHSNVIIVVRMALVASAFLHYGYPGHGLSSSTFMTTSAPGRDISTCLSTRFAATSMMLLNALYGSRPAA